MTKLDACFFRRGEISKTYTWSDDGSAVSITIPISSDVTPAKVDVKILSNTIRAGIKGSPPIVQGALYQEVDVTESMWQIERGSKIRPGAVIKSGTLTLHLWKKSSTMVPWPVLVVGPATPDSPESLDALSLFSLGEALETGRPEYNIQADGATALRHYAKAADLGCVPALMRLAQLFSDGPAAGGGRRLEGLEPNPDTALSLLHKAAEAGEAWGQLQLAAALYDPEAFGGKWKADWVQALSWALLSAQQGCGEACGLVGLLKATGGGGVKVEEGEAVGWLRRAAEAATPPPSALHQLALLLLKRGDSESAMAAFARAARLDPSLAPPAGPALVSAAAPPRKAARAPPAGQPGVFMRDGDAEVAAAVAAGAALVVVAVAAWVYFRRR